MGGGARDQSHGHAAPPAVDVVSVLLRFDRPSPRLSQNCNRDKEVTFLDEDPSCVKPIVDRSVGRDASLAERGPPPCDGRIPGVPAILLYVQPQAHDQHGQPRQTYAYISPHLPSPERHVCGNQHSSRRRLCLIIPFPCALFRCPRLRIGLRSITAQLH